ncbi:hypothetical protein niasHT_029642 [Heterodera trifolii]|uniref:Coiled-coil domain-containing protein 130 n=1 Tax=Heterodera trifolii TaxID=157864 RepID=A0ABD2K233_9BILA
MGERKGQNHYYPPDFNYQTHKTLNRYHGVHALRERGKRANEGILTIRFEMPFNVWCLGCNNHVGMSVRYNAEKRKVGMYYTTPIYEFRMKCHLCDNYFTIRTDPKNFDYELVEGVRRQEIRFDPSTIDNLAPVDRTMSLKLGADAMFKAEHTVDDKKKLASADDQIHRLEAIQTRLYDDYMANSVLRGSFRREKKDLNERRANDKAMKMRLSTELALLPETEEDRLSAKRLAMSKHFTSGGVNNNTNGGAEEKTLKEKLLAARSSSGGVGNGNSLSALFSPNNQSSSNGAKAVGQQMKRSSLGICLTKKTGTALKNNSNGRA